MWENGVNLVENNPHPVPPASGNGKHWHYSYLSRNPNMTWEIVQNNPDKR